MVMNYNATIIRNHSTAGREDETQQHEGHLVRLDIGKDRITLALERYYVNNKTYGDYLGKPLLSYPMCYQRLSAQQCQSGDQFPPKICWS